MELKKMRLEIDSLDSEIISLLSKRFKIVKKVANYKKTYSLEAHQPRRWTEVLIKRKEEATIYDLNPEMIEQIWNIIHENALKTEWKIISLTQIERCEIK